VQAIPGDYGVLIPALLIHFPVMVHHYPFSFTPPHETLALELSPESAGEKIVAEMQAAEGGAWPDAELRKKFDLTPAVLHRRRKSIGLLWRDALNHFFIPMQFTGAGTLLPASKRFRRFPEPR